MLEVLERIWPGSDAELARAAKRLFEKQGIEFRLGVRVAGVRRGGKGKTEKVVVELEGAEPLRCNRPLLAT